MARRVIEVPGIGHAQPIPLGVRIGGTIMSSSIMGKDPATGALLADPGAQVAQAFDNLRSFLGAADATTGDLAHVTVFLEDDAMRDAVNTAWLAMFPDPHDRPARHAVKTTLPKGVYVQLELVAVVEETP